MTSVLCVLLHLACTFKSRTQGLRYRQTRFSRSRYICGFAREEESEPEPFFFFLLVASSPMLLCSCIEVSSEDVNTSASSAAGEGNGGPF